MVQTVTSNVGIIKESLIEEAVEGSDRVPNLFRHLSGSTRKAQEDPQSR
jgi:hypothetical protein